MPCVAEICLGDGIAELSKVQWDRAKTTQWSGQDKIVFISTQKVSENSLKELRTIYKGDITQVAPLLNNKMFDGVALQSLERITAACEGNSLSGTFTTASGNPTMVRISLIPDLNNYSIQRWKVITISRSFPSAISDEQKEKIKSELKSRYFSFGAENSNIRNAKEGEGRYDSTYMGNFGFGLSLFVGSKLSNGRRLHPSCGGSAKVNID